MSDRKPDCCVGEPGGGDPHGLHSLNCPEYLAFCARLDAQRPAPKPPPAAEPTSALLRRELAAVSAELESARQELGRLRAHICPTDERSNP